MTPHQIRRNEERNWALERADAVRDAAETLIAEITHNPLGWYNSQAAVDVLEATGSLFTTDALAELVEQIKADMPDDPDGFDDRENRLTMGEVL